MGSEGGVVAATVFGVAPGNTEFSIAFTLDTDDEFLIPGITVAGVQGIDVYAYRKEAMSDIEVNFGTLSVSPDDLQERVFTRQGGVEAVAEIGFDEPLAVGASPELFMDFLPAGGGRLFVGSQFAISTGGEFASHRSRQCIGASHEAP